eukprot:1497332-Rhodomonas_salina.1
MRCHHDEIAASAMMIRLSASPARALQHFPSAATPLRIGPTPQRTTGPGLRSGCRPRRASAASCSCAGPPPALSRPQPRSCSLPKEVWGGRDQPSLSLRLVGIAVGNGVQSTVDAQAKPFSTAEPRLVAVG